MIDSLLPCPFCGGDAVSEEMHWPDGTTTHGVECLGCEAGFVADSEDDAIAAWNRRTKVTVQ